MECMVTLVAEKLTRQWIYFGIGDQLHEATKEGSCPDHVTAMAVITNICV